MKGNQRIRTSNDKFREGWDRVFGKDDAALTLEHLKMIKGMMQGAEDRGGSIPLSITPEDIACTRKANGIRQEYEDGKVIVIGAASWAHRNTIRSLRRVGMMP